MSGAHENPPASVEELVERLSDVTLDAFLRGWLDAPDRVPAAEESMKALAVWDYMNRVGIVQPAWVSAAHAGLHYGPTFV